MEVTDETTYFNYSLVGYGNLFLYLYIRVLLPNFKACENLRIMSSSISRAHNKKNKLNVFAKLIYNLRD